MVARSELKKARAIRRAWKILRADEDRRAQEVEIIVPPRPSREAYVYWTRSTPVGILLARAYGRIPGYKTAHYYWPLIWHAARSLWLTAFSDEPPEPPA